MMVKKKETKAVVVKEKKELVISTPADMIQFAITNKADLDKLEKVMALQERWEATQAKKLYNVAMVTVHKSIPMIGKTLKNAQTHSSYASLDNIICQTREIYTEQGFSITFYEGTTDKTEHIRICADVLHSVGHKESYYYDVPMDGKGIKGNANMTAIHAKASSTSYARRYLMCMIWNIPTGDDNDSNNGIPAQKAKTSMPKATASNPKDEFVEAQIVDPAPKQAEVPPDAEKSLTEPYEKISLNSAKWIYSLAKSNGFEKEEFLELIGKLGYKKVTEISEQDYDTIMTTIKKPATEYRAQQAKIQEEINWNE